MKYKTLKDLQIAYATGEISESEPLILDNDRTFLYQGTDDDRKKVFDGGIPENLLCEALTLLGIPHEGA